MSRKKRTLKKTVIPAKAALRQSRRTVRAHRLSRLSFNHPTKVGAGIQRSLDPRLRGDDKYSKVLRLIDVNFNRVKEGLRVCEDILRFIYDDSSLTQAFKKIRHDCSKALLKFPVSYRTIIEMRNSKYDVGKRSAISEKKKLNWDDLIVSNLKRAEEGFRVLEEFSKIVAKKTSAQFQSLRFRLYELEKRVFKKI